MVVAHALNSNTWEAEVSLVNRTNPGKPGLVLLFVFCFLFLFVCFVFERKKRKKARNFKYCSGVNIVLISDKFGNSVTF